MKFAEFKNSITEGEIRSVYLLEGEDAFFKKRAIELLKNKYISEPTLNFASFDGGALSINELTASLTAYPFMSEKRLTLVTEHNFTKDELKGELKAYLDNPPSDSILVISAVKSGELIKKFPSVCVVDCSKQDVSLLVRWVKAECSKASINIDSETAKNLCEYCLCDMTRIENETLKLISYAGEGGSIGLDDVDALVARDSEYKIYEMTEYVGKRKFDMALSVITDMLSKGEPPNRLIISIYNYFRRLLHVAISKKDNSELATLIGVKEFAIKKTKEQSKMFKIRALKKAVDTLIDVDFSIKNGSIEQTQAMWLAVFKIMTGE